MANEHLQRCCSSQGKCKVKPPGTNNTHGNGSLKRHDTNCCHGCGETGTPHIAGRNVIRCSDKPLCKTGNFPQIKCSTTMQPSNFIPRSA